MSPGHSMNGASVPLSGLSVGAFLKNIPWSAEARAATASAQVGPMATPETLDMKLSVKAFFSLFDWQASRSGANQVETLKLEVLPVEDEDALTLDGFADLF